ncbi:hypothetical protein CFP56_022781 [Quercus suber]|uniref:Uncharacterized protein n=1 Tax=Quercus suber TaxID=58331 RepID=A0AAW0KB11_QUESU
MKLPQQKHKLSCTSSLNTRIPEKVTSLIVDTHALDLEFSPFHVTQMLHAHNGNHHPPFAHIGHDHDHDIGHNGHDHPGHPDDHTGSDFDDAHSGQGLGLGLGLNAYAHAQAVHTIHDHPLVQHDHGPALFHHVGPSHALVQPDHN